MDGFWKAAAAVLLVLVLLPTLDKTEKDLSTLLLLAVSCMGAAAAFAYLEPVLDLLWELKALGELSGELLKILIKAVGIGLIAEMVGLLCADAGKASLGKTLQLLASAWILYLSIPVFRAFLTLIQEILNQV